MLRGLRAETVPNAAGCTCAQPSIAGQEAWLTEAAAKPATGCQVIFLDALPIAPVGGIVGAVRR